MKKPYYKSYLLPCCNGSKVEGTTTDTCVFLKLFAALSDLIYGNMFVDKAKNMCFGWCNNYDDFFGC